MIDGEWPKAGPLFKGDERKRFRLGAKTDAEGYTCHTEAADYVEATTTVPITGDEAVATVNLPFDFPFYGEYYDSAEISTNGHFRFVSAADTAYSNPEIPNAALPNAVVAPLWDDLVLDATSSVRTAAGSGSFTIEYRDALFYETTLRVDVAVTLYEDGQILFTYRNLDGADERELGSSATVGIENATGTIGLQYSLNEAVLSNETAIRFLPPAA